MNRHQPWRPFFLWYAAQTHPARRHNSSTATTTSSTFAHHPHPHHPPCKPVVSTVYPPPYSTRAVAATASAPRPIYTTRPSVVSCDTASQSCSPYPLPASPNSSSSSATPPPEVHLAEFEKASFQPSGRLKGKVALICGAGNVPGEAWGIGSCTAMQFAREGAKVVVMSRTPAKVNALAQAIRAEVGGDVVLPLAADVTRPYDVERVLQEAIGHFGGVDAVVNAGVYCSKYNGLNKLSIENWRNSIQLNLHAQFLLIHYMVPHLVARGGGTLQFVSTIATMHTLGRGKQRLSYASGKAGAENVTMQIGTMYARKNIRSNVVRVGYVDSPLVSRAATQAGVSVAKLRDERNRYCPSGLQGVPLDVAHACVFLASDESKYVNGTALTVDGGVSLAVHGGFPLQEEAH